VAELDMLDTLPSSTAQSRLACQIKVGSQLQNVVFQLKEISQ
jgi:2Fe-2S ferredoxin